MSNSAARSGSPALTQPRRPATSDDGLISAANRQNFICMAGHFEDTQTSTCEACAADTFKEGSGNLASLCVGCKDHSATVYTASTSANECLCLKGFQVGGGSTDDSCEQCPTGSFKTANGNSACQTCPGGYTTVDLQAFDVTQCVAEPGFTNETNEFTAFFFYLFIYIYICIWRKHDRLRRSNCQAGRVPGQPRRRHSSTLAVRARRARRARPRGTERLTSTCLASWVIPHFSYFTVKC